MISTRICEKLFAGLDVCATKSLGLCYNSSSMEKPGCKLNCLLTLSNTFVFASHEPDYHCQLGNKIWNHFYATSRFHSQGSLLQGFVIFAYIHTIMLYIYINIYIRIHSLPQKKHIVHIQYIQYTDARSFIGVFCCLFTLTNGLVHFSNWVNPNWWWLSRFELCLGCTGCNL